MSLGRYAGYLVGIYQPTRDTAASLSGVIMRFGPSGNIQRFIEQKPLSLLPAVASNKDLCRYMMIRRVEPKTTLQRFVSRNCKPVLKRAKSCLSTGVRRNDDKQGPSEDKGNESHRRINGNEPS